MTDPSAQAIAEVIDLARVADDQLAAACDLRREQSRLERVLRLLGLSRAAAGRPTRAHPESVRRAADALDRLAAACASLGDDEIAGATPDVAGWGDELWRGHIDGWEARRRVDRLLGAFERALLRRAGS